MARLEATSAKEVNNTWEVVTPTRRWVERHQSQATTKKVGRRRSWHRRVFWQRLAGAGTLATVDWATPLGSWVTPEVLGSCWSEVGQERARAAPRRLLGDARSSVMLCDALQ
ncbi:unnamed protein product, partial [Ilex paraguariensis]